MTTAKLERVTLSYHQSIETRYFPNTRRIKVIASGGYSRTYGWNDALDIAENHALAIQQFLDLMEWEGTYTIGSSVSGRGYVAVKVSATPERESATSTETISN